MIGPPSSTPRRWGWTWDTSAGEGTHSLRSAENTALEIYETPSAGKAAHTLAAWLVTDLPAVVAELKGKGVKFDDYDLPDIGIQTEDGVATMPEGMAAWFRDSEGNILGLFSPPTAG